MHIWNFDSSIYSNFSKDILPKNYIDKYDMDSMQKRIKEELEKLINNELREIDDYIKNNYNISLDKVI